MAERENAVTCQFCGDGPEIEEIAGKLHAETSDSGKIVCAHHRCMQYASALAQYKTEEFGGFDIDDVEKEINRGKKLKCALCKASSKRKEKSKGASCGCAVKSCRKTFHYPCAFNDPTAITKRLVVTMNKNSNKEKFVYYRVFCSKAHEEVFRKVLKDELRDGKSKRGRPSGDSNNNEGDGYSSQDGEAVADTPVEAETSGLNNSFLKQSPAADNVPLSLSPGQRFLLSFADNLAKRDTAATESSQKNTEDTQANISPQDIKDRRKSGFVRPSRPARSAARVSQPPSCSMIEEASNSNQSNRSMEQSTASEQSISPKTTVKMPDIEGGALNAQDIVHKSGKTDKVKELQMNYSSLEVQTDGNQVCDVDASSDSAVSPLDSVDSFLSDNVPMDPANVSLSSNTSKSLRRSTRESVVLTLESTTDGRKTRSSPIKYVIKSTGSPKKNQDSVAKVTPQSSPGNSPQKRQRPVRECVLRNSSAEDAHTDSATDMDTSYESAECSVTDSSYKSVDSSVRIPLLKISDRKNDSACSSKVNTSPGVGAVAITATEQPDTNGVSASGDNSVDMTSQSRKRKASDLDISHSSATSEIKSRKSEKSSDATAHATVVLIPSTMENFEDLESVVLEMASDVIQVKTGSVCVWQTITGQTLPTQLSLFFMMDLVRKAETGDTEAVLKLLFDKDHLAAEKSRYNEQANIFRSLSDPNAQEDVRKAFWAGLEKTIKTLPMVHLLRLPGQELVSLAIDVRHCNESQKFQAHLQAFKGLTRWNKSTNVADFKLLPNDRSLAARAEIWTWQVWLTTICPVSQITVLPSDTYLLDTAQHAEYQSFVQFLKNNNSPSAASKTGHDSLLVFKHVDLNLLDFQAYFRKVCKDALETKKSDSRESKTPLSILSLIPLDNLDESSYKSVLSLMGNANGKASGYSVSVRSAFCPHTHLTKLVLLEIMENQHPTDIKVTEGEEADKAPGKRGRPKKLPVS